MARFKVGQRVKIVNPANGCKGAKGYIGVVTDEDFTNGLDEDRPGVNIRITKNPESKSWYGSVWRVNEDALVEYEIPTDQIYYILAITDTKNQNDHIQIVEDDLQEVMENIRYFLEKGFEVKIHPGKG